MKRRSFLSCLALPAWARASTFRYAVCNETFEGETFPKACEIAKAAGYTGLEIAPGTLGEGGWRIDAAKRAELRRVMEATGLRYAGLHSLMPADPTLHLTTPDNSIRTKSWEHFRRLIDLSGDLGGGVMVLGSGKQRAAVNGSTPRDATQRLQEGLAGCADSARSRDVTLLLEPLSPQFTNVVNTVAEAVSLVSAIRHPAVSSMIDTHNTTAETEPHDRVIHRHIRHIRHVHVNEMDGRHPGTGNYDFVRVFRALREVKYDGWVSLEVFQFKPSGQAIATESMAFLRSAEKRSEGGWK